MQQTITTYKQTYDAVLRNELDHTVYFLDCAKHNLNYMAKRLELGPRSQSIYPHGHQNKGIMDYGWDAFTQAKGVFDVVWQSLASIDRIEQMVDMNNINDTVKLSLPTSLWTGPTEDERCKQLLELESMGYKVLVQLIHEALRNWKILNDGMGNSVGWPNTMDENISERQGNITSLKSCVNEYKDAITKALDDISAVKLDAENLLNADAHFDYDTYKRSVMEDTEAINESASWLYAQLQTYHSFNVSKTDLAENVLDTNIQDKVRRRMESILFNTDLDAIFNLQTEAQTVRSNVQKWFTACLDISNTLVDYFGYDLIVAHVRTLNIWRKPTVDFRTPGVMEYTYDPGESWRTWPTSISMEDLTTSVGLHYISTLLDSYMAGINEALYDVQHTLLITKEEALSVFDTLSRELNSYQQLGQVDGNFVRYSLLSCYLSIYLDVGELFFKTITLHTCEIVHRLILAYLVIGVWSNDSSRWDTIKKTKHLSEERGENLSYLTPLFVEADITLNDNTYR